MQGAPATLGELMRHARRRLAAAGIDNAGLDARLLVEHFTGTTLTDAVARPDMPVDANAAAQIEAALSRRAAGEPVHRILGSREFYGLRLALSAGTLEPRPDTEALVEAALPFAKRAADRHGACRILDLGTGTGAVALALLANEPRAEALASDISPDALATAAANADMTGVAPRFTAVRSDWFGRIEGRFHLVVSNPPYIASSEIAMLAKEVREHDPRVALDGGGDGLDAYRAIAAGAPAHLEADGVAAVEIGIGQETDVEALFAAQGLRLVGTARDLADVLRALVFAR